LSWSDEFDDPIPGMPTLQDAADHILKLPKAQQQLPHWHRRRDADQGGGIARLDDVRADGHAAALNHGRERVFSDRKETHWGKRRLKRDQ
jgi:hypothetical protein